MNTLEIIGGRKDQRELVENVVNTMLHELGLCRTRALEIEVKITRGLLEKTGGEAFHLEGENHKCHEIEIDAELGLRDFITAICHEMVHLKQAYRKELIQKDGKMFWKGRDCTDVEYLDQPWEKEAYRLQDKLALKAWENL